MPAISFQSVSKRYPSPRGPQGGTFLALDDVSLAVEEGEFFGLLGPNGAGKTTLITILAGLAKASSGRVSVMGHDVQTDFAAARRALGVVPQELVFDPFFNVREALLFQSGYFGVKNNAAWVDELLDNLGLTDKANANMRALSGGMKRRVLVALALVHKPPVIVLDEPTAGVDVELRQTLWHFIAKLNKQGHTVLLTTHYLEEAEEADRVCIIKEGRVIALGTPEDIKKNIVENYLVVDADDRATLRQELVRLGLDFSEGEQFRVDLRVRRAQEVIRAIETPLTVLNIHNPSLEDAYLEIVQEKAQ